MDGPAFIFPAPNLFSTHGAPFTLGTYRYFSVDLRGGKKSKYAFGWHKELAGKGSPTGTWMQELCFADYTLGDYGFAKITTQYRTDEAHHVESNWLKADGTLLWTKRTAVPHDLRLNIEYLEESVHYEPGKSRLGISHGQRPILMASKLITGPENTGPSTP